jgi:MarR family 2-MHQ and catechol resistance regulon transcriptional repressor
MGSRHRGPKNEIQALGTFVALSRASECATAATQFEIVKAGLTEGQFGILEALHHLGPLCAADLAEKVLRSRGNLTLVIANLERDGLVERTTRSEDRRYRTVALTGKGRRLISGLFPKHARLVAKTFSILTEEEQVELKRLCRKLGKSAAEGL